MGSAKKVWLITGASPGFGKALADAVARDEAVAGACEELSLDRLREQMELNFFATAEMTRSRAAADAQAGLGPHPHREQHRRAGAAPPVRLMLGRDAHSIWDATIARRIEDIDAWRPHGEDTAFDSAGVVEIKL